jgi:ferrous iron transport protein A
MNTLSMKLGFGKRWQAAHQRGHGQHSSSLTGIASGSSAQVFHLGGGPEARRKLLDMGIFPGEQVRVVKNDGDGPVLLQVRGGTIMVGRGLADKIRVKMV